MKTKLTFLTKHESYLLGGLSAIILVALFPLLIGLPLSFEFAITYWTVAIVLATVFAVLVLMRQGREIKKSENQIRVYEEMVRNLKNTK